MASGDGRTSTVESVDQTPVLDDEFYVPFLPQLSPKCLTISRQYMLDLALKRLGLSIEETEFTDAGDGEMYASISIDLSIHTENPSSQPTKIHGDYAGTKEGALESASSTVLSYLKTASMIYIDDGNLCGLRACQTKLLAASSWSMLFESQATDLKKQLSILTRQIERYKATNIQSKCCSNNLDAQSVPKELEFPASKHTPPHSAEPSKRARSESACVARRNLFGNHCHVQTEDKGPN